ncbi:hypothetical protein M422DRAFT_783932 [Sphaerobolus stellatus SS14]|uniref:F-box domain-containing protein n=1 Tax=Sphaerobolus stellatus (strain SS14) TaxID=990650 RepID=A0A0C9UNX0_SPHS4|nr:hypothetical protein M422DRAFT_783932 [Sphaerobolus stellatus SS14]
MQLQQPLPNLPQEIIDKIIHEIESPRSLLRFALTCKTFCTLIIPYQIQFRILRINVYERVHQRLWDILSTRPTLLSRYRKVEIVSKYDENSELEACLPSCLLATPRSESFRTYLAPTQSEAEFFAAFPSIRNMRNLTSFTVRFFNIPFIAILQVLSHSAPNLTHLELGTTFFPHKYNNHADKLGHVPPLEKPLYNLKSLKLLDFSLQGASAKEFLDELNFLTPNISTFEVHSYGRSLPLDIFRWTNWPFLTSVFVSFYYKCDIKLYENWLPGKGLIADSGTDTSTTSTIISFFKRHSKITTLVIQSNIVFLSEALTPDALPNLNKFATNLPLHTILTISLASQLIHVCSLFTEASRKHLAEMKHLRQCVAHVRTELSEFLADLSPHIQRLIIHDPIIEYHSLLIIIRALDNLTHLGGIKFIDKCLDPSLLTSELTEHRTLTYLGGMLEDGLCANSRVSYERGKYTPANPIEVFFADGGHLDNTITWVSVAELRSGQDYRPRKTLLA